jgi:NADH:ubiquinone oxidoreductase subunit E
MSSERRKALVAELKNLEIQYGTAALLWALHDLFEQKGEPWVDVELDLAECAEFAEAQEGLDRLDQLEDLEKVV